MATKKITRRDISSMSTKQFMKVSAGPYKRLFAYLLPYKVRFGLGLFFGVLYGLTNGLLLLTIRYVMAIIFPDGGGKTKDMLIHGVDPNAVGFEGVLFACALIPAIMVIRGACSYLNSYFMLWVSVRVLNDIRTQVFDSLMKQSLGFFGKMKAGELIQVVFNQTRMAQSALTTIASDVIKQPVSIISALAVLFYFDWKFTLMALILFPACLVPVMLIGKKVRKAGGKEEEEAGMLMVVMQEAFAGIKVVKSHAREEYESKRFLTANLKMLTLIMRWRKAMEIVGPMVEAVASLGISMALLYAWWLGLPAATFMALQGGLVLLYPPFKTLSKLHILMQKCLAATTKVFELMERVPDIQDKPDAIKLTDCQGAITFENIGFSYVEGTPALENVSLTIEPGKTYALVGASGAGKSTMFSLLLRFYDPDQGRVLVDGHDIRDITQQSLRNQIGMVSQDTFLFHDSIYENIRYGRLAASKKSIEEASKKAFAHDFILKQSDGYNTQVGDKGCLLSGGQQQRVSIARAILRNAPILLLDEATSALDSESEKKIQSAIDNLSKGKTVIAIAHRLSTILNADQIVVMDQGQIVEVGTHAELLVNSSHYKHLYDLQFNQAGKVDAD